MRDSFTKRGKTLAERDKANRQRVGPKGQSACSPYPIFSTAGEAAMDCRKCGNKKLTRRSAGAFFCQHCGMQPGSARFDRSASTTTPSLRQAAAKQQEQAQ